MKCSPVLLVAACIGQIAAAIKIEDYLPECSIKCLNDGSQTATDCKLGDAVCFCVQANYEAIYNSALSCVLRACGNDVSLNDVLPGAANYCRAASASASAETASSTKAPASSTGASAPATTPSVSSTGQGSAPTGASNSTATTSGPESSHAASTTGAATSTTATPAAAPKLGSVGGFAMLGLGALAIF